jgi:hypothetical protein
MSRIMPIRVKSKKIREMLARKQWESNARFNYIQHCLDQSIKKGYGTNSVPIEFSKEMYELQKIKYAEIQEEMQYLIEKINNKNNI